VLWPVAEFNQPGRRQAKRFSAEIGAGPSGQPTPRATRAGQTAARTRCDGAARAAGDEQTRRASFVATRVAKEALEPVRAYNGSDPQRQGWQAERVGKMVKLQEAENQIEPTTKSTITVQAIQTC